MSIVDVICNFRLLAIVKAKKKGKGKLQRMHYFTLRCNECCCCREWHADFNVGKHSHSFHSARFADGLTDARNKVWRSVHIQDIAGSHCLVLSA
jgi:hypothetical protein